MAAELPPGAVRAMGIVETNDGLFEFQQVSIRLRFTRLDCAIDRSQIVVPDTLDSGWLANRLS